MTSMFSTMGNDGHQASKPTKNGSKWNDWNTRRARRGVEEEGGFGCVCTDDERSEIKTDAPNGDKMKRIAIQSNQKNGKEREKTTTDVEPRNVDGAEELTSL